jgi:2-hydroxy-3-oxopropionate reductase
VPIVTSVAVIGLGIMGGPMARNLVKAGFEVIGYNRSRAKVERLVEHGGRGAANVAEAVRDADVVITVLPDSPDVEATVLGPDGVLATARAGSLYIDMSTIRPDVAKRLFDEGRRAGIRVLDAPVSGGEQGAIAGTLSVMVGGEAETVAAARPILEAIGSTVVHVGPPGAGQTVKAANQLVAAGNIQLVAEAIVFLEAYGVDTTAAVKALSGGLAGSAVLDRKAPDMIARRFRPGFTCQLHHKDLGILTSAAREAGVVLPLGAAVTQLMASLVAQGFGGLDNGALLTLVEQLSGRTATPTEGSAVTDK